jgi:hypothetical protein
MRHLAPHKNWCSGVYFGTNAPGRRRPPIEERDALVERTLARMELERRQTEERCSLDPLYWLQCHTKTENEKHLEQGVPFRQHFPKKAYFEVVMKYMMTEKRLFIAKSREMMTSWLAMGMVTHAAQFRTGVLVLVQTEKEDKVKALIRYCSVLYHNQDEWLKERHELAAENTTELEWTNRSRIIGIPKGEHQVTHNAHNSHVIGPGLKELGVGLVTQTMRC